MSTHELAVKIATAAEAFDCYGFQDACDSIEEGASQISNLLAENPYEIIDQLCDIILEMA